MWDVCSLNIVNYISQFERTLEKEIIILSLLTYVSINRSIYVIVSKVLSINWTIIYGFDLLENQFEYRLSNLYILE